MGSDGSIEGYGLDVDVRPMSGDGYAVEGEGDGYATEGDGYIIDLNPVSI